MLATLAHVEAHPEQHNQRQFLYTCRSGCCFAGWALAIHRRQEPIRDSPFIEVASHRMDRVEAQARKALGITRRQAGDLFEPYNDLEDLGLFVERIIERAFW